MSNSFVPQHLSRAQEAGQCSINHHSAMLSPDTDQNKVTSTQFYRLQCVVQSFCTRREIFLFLAWFFWELKKRWILSLCIYYHLYVCFSIIPLFIWCWLAINLFFEIRIKTKLTETAEWWCIIIVTSFSEWAKPAQTFTNIMLWQGSWHYPWRV